MMERVRLTIDGMSCGHCVRAVDQALRRLPGVQVEQVEIGAAVVTYDAAAVEPDRIDALISEEGYEVRSRESVP